MAIDMVGFVPLTTTNVSTTGTKTVTMTAIGSSAAKVDRYANGVGLRMFVAADTAMGANAPTCIINYLDQGGEAGATTSFTSTASLGIGSLLNTGAAANNGTRSFLSQLEILVCLTLFRLSGQVQLTPLEQ